MNEQEELYERKDEQNGSKAVLLVKSGVYHVALLPLAVLGCHAQCGADLGPIGKLGDVREVVAQRRMLALLGDVVNIQALRWL